MADVTPNIPGIKELCLQSGGKISQGGESFLWVVQHIFKGLALHANPNAFCEHDDGHDGQGIAGLEVA